LHCYVLTVCPIYALIVAKNREGEVKNLASKWKFSDAFCIWINANFWTYLFANMSMDSDSDDNTIENSMVITDEQLGRFDSKHYIIE